MEKREKRGQATLSRFHEKVSRRFPEGPINAVTTCSGVTAETPEPSSGSLILLLGLPTLLWVRKRRMSPKFAQI